MLTFDRKITLLVIIIICTSLHSVAKITITDTYCNYQHGTAIVIGKAFVGWAMASNQNEDFQTASEIIIRERVTNREVYNSHKVNTDKSQQIMLPTLPQNKYGYSWQVRVWDKEDKPSGWSQCQHFRIMPDSLEGQWIGAITRKDARLPEGRWANSSFKSEAFKTKWKDVDSLSSRSIILAKDFMTTQPISDAVIYISGLGHYKLTINGNDTNDSEFAPLWSEYSKTVYYNVIDITSRLKQSSSNHIEVLLGNGFFNVQANGRYSKLQTSYGPPQMLCMVRITYRDGSVQTISSDDTWQWCLSPITFNSIYGGENYDATLEDQKEWHPVVITEGPTGQLMAQTAPPVKIMEKYDVRSWKHLEKEDLEDVAKEMKRKYVSLSAIVADMGQNLAGFPQITLSGKRGQKVLIYVGERLTLHGAVNQRETGRQHYYEYTLRGDEIETWHPHFSYYGFRYIQVEGAVMQGEQNPNDLPVIQSLQSCFVSSSAKRVSTFSCSNDLFTNIHQLIERAESSNMQAVLTDCPHREKLGWLEQDHLNGPSLLYNYDMSTYIKKIIRDITDTQKNDGMVPTTAPQYVTFGDLFDNSVEWGSTLIILPFMYYDQYGDSTLIVDNYEAMKHYVDYLTAQAKNGILDFGLGDWYDYGPWKAGFSKNTPISLVATAYYIMDIRFVSEAARMKGNSKDANKYALLYNKAVETFNTHFFKKDSYTYGSGSQTSLALPLYLGITGKHHDGVLKNLLSDISFHGYRLTTGDIGNRYLIQTLAHENMDTLVYKMFNHEDTPGYGFQIKQGATTLTEQWNPQNGTSWNHFMMGQLDEWLFCSLAGIKQKLGTHGMRHLIIHPHLMEDMYSLQASIETLYGKVAISVSDLGLTIVIPVGCDADIIALDGKVHHVGSGIWSFPSVKK